MSYLLIDPQSVADYAVDWDTHLGDDTVSTATWTISPTGPTLSSQTSADGIITCFVGGCERTKVYRLAGRVQTAQGRTLTRSFILRCEQR